MDRMELIGSAILNQARQEARELIDKANETRESEIARFEEEVIGRMFGTVQSKAAHIRLESVKSAARGQLEAHRSLLAHRAGKTAQVFKAVESRLSDYAKTAEYRDEALKRAEKIKDEYAPGSSEIFVRGDDMGLGSEIARILGGGDVKADAGIRIGGFKLLNRQAGVLLDETLDERLEDQKLWFLQNCGLKII